MAPKQQPLDFPKQVNLGDRSLLIFAVASEAGWKIEEIISRMPPSLCTEAVELLIIDDSASGGTFDNDGSFGKPDLAIKTTVLRPQDHHGYGGNQKLAYRYAIDNGFDFVAFLHANKTCALEKLPDLLAPLLSDKADAVFCPRTAAGSKRLGAELLTTFQNRMLRTTLSGFRLGYRAFATAALALIPFEKNADDLHFDTEIIVQLALRQLRIVEVPISNDEPIRRNGLRYTAKVCKTILRAKFHEANLLFDRKFDVHSPEEKYEIKLGYLSSHTAAIAAARPGTRLLDLGCGQGHIAGQLATKGCRVTGMDQYIPEASPDPARIDFIRWNLNAEVFPINVSEFDQVLMLDIIEHLKEPETFMDTLRHAAVCKRPEVIITTANIGFIVTRLMLLLGQFNYGRKGILDLTHTRLFTFRSLGALLEQSGYKVLEVRGIPAPFPKAIGDNFISRFLLWLNQALIRVSKGVFSYQIFVRAEAKPTVYNLLRETLDSSNSNSRPVLKVA